MSYCPFCDTPDHDELWTLRIGDDKGYVEFEGHKDCLAIIKEQTLTDCKGKSVKQTLKMLNLEQIAESYSKGPIYENIRY
ncbi:hypothetical protein ABEP12_02100 [Bacillus velezensis]